MELERMGRSTADGHAIPYDGEGPTVRKVLELIQSRRGGDPVYEGTHLIGLDAPWGTISLEPGGQVEWSSRPYRELSELSDSLREHLAMMQEVEAALSLVWLDAAVDPELGLSEMPWMPKARYRIMRPYLGKRGRLAHRMMTQTASIQCAFDFSDAEDWRRKFKAGALLAPMVTAMFANSSRIDGSPSGYRCYRHVIWNDTDPDRCSLPPIVFDSGFGVEGWLDYVLDVPTIFRHRARGLVPSGGMPFRALLERVGCDAIKAEDWETHISTIFTEVRSYTYIEVRSTDVQPDEHVLAIPTFWTGVLYHDDALDEALRLGAVFDDYERWIGGMHSAAREGLDGRPGRHPIRELAAEALRISLRGLERGATCTTGGRAAATPLLAFAEQLGIDLA
jgi:glutamate--cysteine ligase